MAAPPHSGAKHSTPPATTRRPSGFGMEREGASRCALGGPIRPSFVQCWPNSQAAAGDVRDDHSVEAPRGGRLRRREVATALSTRDHEASAWPVKKVVEPQGSTPQAPRKAAPRNNSASSWQLPQHPPALRPARESEAAPCETCGTLQREVPQAQPQPQLRSRSHGHQPQRIDAEGAWTSAMDFADRRASASSTRCLSQRRKFAWPQEAAAATAQAITRGSE